eukprot:scaffold599967_cov33-Prasinocladus_malaysianus.AAC.1
MPHAAKLEQGSTELKLQRCVSFWVWLRVVEQWRSEDKGKTCFTNTYEHQIECNPVHGCSYIPPDNSKFRQCSPEDLVRSKTFVCSAKLSPASSQIRF